MSFDSYADYSSAISSEKITLAVLEASKRLVAWTLHSGSIYKKTSQDYAVISSLKYNSSELTQVYSLAEVVAGSFYNDRENQIIYIRLSDSSSPANKFIFITFKMFLSNIPVTLPWNLDSGFDIFWEPQIDSTSQFGVEIDTINQQSDAIEGKGTLTLHNDQDFWPSNFDKLFFENQNCWIYSYNRDLPASEAKLLFKGKIESKGYSSKKITFQMKDLISRLKDVIPLSDIGDLVDSGYRPLPSQYTAKQRMIFGRVKGFKPTNIDNVIDSRYPLTGTIVATNSSATITGTGTSFLTELSPDDRLDINDVIYTISAIASDTSLTLTEIFAEATTGPISIDFLPAGRKRFINRIWSLAGHALCQPVPTVLAGSSTLLLNISSTENIFAGDDIYIGTLGSGLLATVQIVRNSNILVLSTSLPFIPVAGTVVTKPCVQNLRINDTKLNFYDDYTINPSTGILTLRDNAEINAAETRQSLQQATFTNGSRNVTGSGTSFKSTFYPGYVIRPSGTTTWHEILSVTDDTNMILRTAFASSTETDYIQYKSLIYNTGDTVLTCEILGRTDDGLSSGSLLTKGPEIVKTLLTDAGLTNDLNTTSFTDAQDIAPEDIAFVLPQKFDGKTTITYRDAINNVNRSIFGILYQNNSFQLGYDILRPTVPTNMVRIEESDIIDFSISSTNKNMVKTVKVQYLNKEYDYTTNAENFTEVQSSSDIATYIIQTAKEKVIQTLLINETDAQRLADRWSFLLEFSSNSITIKTKLLTAELEINDVIDINHRKIFERFGGTSKRKIVAIERIEKSGTDVEIEAVDLSNAFNRIALITNGTTDWVNSNEDLRIYTGYISDDDGMIDDDENSFYTNLIW